MKTTDIEEYKRRRLDEQASHAAINRELAAVKRAFTLGLRAEKITKKPYIALLEEDNVRQGFFEPWQFEQVLAKLPDPLRPPVTFAYYTGWRIHSEIFPLSWEQVDMDAKTVRREPGTTKNKAGRTVYLPTVLWDVMERQWQTKPEGCPWVFHQDGQRIKNFRKAWTNACQEAGVPSRIPHDFRRTAARNLIRAGVPERVAMMITGHKTRSVFDRYNIVSPGDLQEAARRIDQGVIAALTSPTAPSGQEPLPEALPS